MKSAKIIKILFAMTLLMLVSLTGILDAQRSLHLRLPYNGTYRTTSYIDHRTPNYDTDGNMYVYNDEEYPDCAGGGTFTGPYCYDGHDGMDYALPCGTPVLAATTGTVSFVGWEYGNTVIIDHGDGYTTFYGHLQTNSFNVNVDDTVQVGQQIALSDNTGISGGCHLHFGVHHNGLVIDPFGWMGSRPDPISQPDTGGEASSCHWGDGQCLDVLVEDKSNRFYEFGTGWDNWSTGGNSWTQHYIPNTVSVASSYARYRPYIPHSGPYAVYVWIPSILATTSNARYEISDGSNQHYVDVDQQIHSNEWVYLGSFHFWKGTPGYVRLNSNTGESSGSSWVGFDSVRFRQYRTYLPMIVKSPLTLTRIIDQSSDDAGPHPSSCAFSTGWNEIYLGQCVNGQPITSGFRFSNIDIPNGSQILNAYLEFTVDGTYTVPVAVTFYGEASGNAQSFSSSNRPDNRVLTIANSGWSVTDSWILGHIRSSPDLKTIIQEIVNRSDWVGGHALAIIMADAGSTTNQHRRVIGNDRTGQYNGPDHAARLIITYTE